MAFGGEFILRPRSWQRLARFAGVATVEALSPSAYGPAARGIVAQQIYLTAWKVLPGYLGFAALLSLVLIEIVKSAAHAYGLSQYAVELVLRVLVIELIPLMTAIFVALRSGSAIGAEIAMRRVAGELEDPGGWHAGPLHGELAPRVAGAALSMFALTTLACALAMYLTYVAFYGNSTAGFVVFTRTVGQVFDLEVLAGLPLKSLLFGLAVALIPLAAGLEAERGDPRSVPFTVVAGLVKLFFVIGAIEVLALTVKYV